VIYRPFNNDSGMRQNAGKPGYHLEATNPSFVIVSPCCLPVAAMMFSYA
jgi:hypothetical protein